MKKFQSTAKTKQTAKHRGKTFTQSASKGDAKATKATKAASKPKFAAPKPSSTPHQRTTKPRIIKTRIIESEQDIKDGISTLRRICPHLKKAHDVAGNPPLRRNEGGFTGLARIIVGQQLSVLAAKAIWTRVDALIKPMTPQNLVRHGDDELRATGLSRGKVKTLRAIAEATSNGLDLDQLAVIDEQNARDQMIAVSGIGPWTADIYLMFCVGRADIFAPGDLALQVAAQMVMNLDERPSIKEMATIAERWSPWRGVAARLLWHYYAVEKSKKSLMPV